MVYKYKIFRLLIVLGVVLHVSWAFGSPAIAKMNAKMNKVAVKVVPPEMRTTFTTNLTPLQMALSPSPEPHHHHYAHDMMLAITAAILAILVAFGNPLPLSHGDFSRNPSSPVHSSSQLISRIEVTPLGGGGFGGLGFGPGFVPVPFGGFGFGFSIRNRPPPPTEQQILEASKQKLDAVKEYSRRLENQVKAMEQDLKQKQPHDTSTKT